MKKDYFKQRKGDPLPFTVEVLRQVRFEEVDALGYVWHGHYPSYLEDGRVALGRRLGLDYDDFFKQSVLAPVRTMHLDYRIPLRYPETVTIFTRLHFCEAARLDFSYEILNKEKLVTTTGYTTQLFTTPEGEPLLVRPAFITTLFEGWKAGRVS